MQRAAFHPRETKYRWSHTDGTTVFLPSFLPFPLLLTASIIYLMKEIKQNLPMALVPILYNPFLELNQKLCSTYDAFENEI